MSTNLLPKHQALNQEASSSTRDFHPLELCPQKPRLHLVAQEGQLHVHTAPYRGSFAGVLREALRSAGLGSKVIIAQFLKGGVNQGKERAIKLCGRLNWVRPDVSYSINTNCSEASSDKTHEVTTNAVDEIWQFCKQHLLEGDIDQLVLDEAGLAIALGYLKEEEFISTLEQRPKAMDVIITGPSIPSRIMEIADQITELRCGF